MCDPFPQPRKSWGFVKGRVPGMQLTGEMQWRVCGARQRIRPFPSLMDQSHLLPISLYVLHRELAGVSIHKLSSAKASMSCFLQTTVLFHVRVTELCFHHSPLSFQRALSPSSPKWRQWSALSSARTLGMSPDSQTSSAPAHSLWGLFAESSHYLIVNASHLDAGHVCISTYSLFYYLFCL